MPVVNTENVTYRALPVTVNQDGSVRVTVQSMLGSELLTTKDVLIPADEMQSIWMAMPMSGQIRWTDLKEQLYGILIARGDIAGTMI